MSEPTKPVVDAVAPAAVAPAAGAAVGGSEPPKPLVAAIEQIVGTVARGLEANTAAFRQPEMGGRLVTVGLLLLLGVSVVRCLQWWIFNMQSAWLVRGAGAGAPHHAASLGPDDLFFVVLAVIASLMMLGGVVINVFYLWNARKAIGEGMANARRAYEEIANRGRAREEVKQPDE